MTESLNNLYKTLFEVRLLHHYWLDEDVTVFDLIADADQKNQRLLNYDRRSFLAVAPTITTAKRLKGLGCIYKDSAMGFVVASPGTKVIPADTLFEFVITVTNSDFFNYTALTLSAQKTAEIFYPPEDTVYRYKENVPLLSNLTGVSRASGSDKTLFLSSDYSVSSPNDKVESLLITAGGALEQLTSDAPSPTSQQLNAQASNLPVFVHQDDVPVIVPPSGLTGAPQRGIRLSGDIPDNVFALVRLSPLRADDNSFSFTDGNGLAKTPYPIFQIRFKNRSTIRRYINKRTGAVVLTESDPLPLTCFRSPSSDSKLSPTEGWVKAEKSGTKIIRLISEIFV